MLSGEDTQEEAQGGGEALRGPAWGSRMVWCPTTGSQEGWVGGQEKSEGEKPRGRKGVQEGARRRQEMGQGGSSPWPLGSLGTPACSASAGEPPPPPLRHPVHLLWGQPEGPQTTQQGGKEESSGPSSDPASLCNPGPARLQRKRIHCPKCLFQLSSMRLKVSLILGLCSLPLGSPTYLPQAQP